MSELLISADSHVKITEDWVRERLPDHALEAYDNAVRELEAFETEQRGGKRMVLEDGDWAEFAPGAKDPGYWDPHERLKAMDRDGVHAEVLYSELSAFRQFHLAGDHWKDVARAFNDSLSDFAAVDPKRLVVSYQVPIIDIDHAASEVYRLAELGARSIHLPNYPAELGFPDYHDESYDPLWAALVDTGITISQHLGIKNSLLEVARRDPTPLRSIFTSLPSMMLCENLGFWLMTGVLERFPTLRIVFVEASLGWFTNYLNQLESAYQRGGERMFPGVKRSPIETFREQIAMTFIGNDRPSIEGRHLVGVENLMWSTDFPHPASTWPNSIQIVEEAMKGVPEDERHLLVAGNAMRFYGLEAA